eukprot:TRINITY_DN33358_c0_g1_i1.p1 TRINITY_DN33358_c0_g1~~TRINITY_DN33358_c0_g1_i1.p1  ORF type:complete len:492 (+),score=93.90 TRINITY_DN33358_c0_g1_i1:41-1477(+)
MSGHNVLWDGDDRDYPKDAPGTVEMEEWFDPPDKSGKVTYWDDEDDIASARREHVNPGAYMGLCEPLDALLETYGYGYYVYFDFMRVLIVLSVVLFILQLVPYIWYLSENSPGFHDTNTLENKTGYKDFFISEYTSSEKGAWFAANILCIIVSVCTVFYIKHRIRMKREECIERGLIPNDALGREIEDRIIRYKDANGSTVEDKVTDWDNVSIGLRVVGAVMTFAIFITVTIVVSYYSTRSAESEQQQGNTALISWLLSILVQILNALYLLVANETTMMLPVSTWTTFTKVYIAKMVLFRVCQTIALFATRSYKGHCAYYIIGEQFFFLMVTDLTLGNVLEVVSPWIAAYIKRFIYRNTDLLVGYTEADLLPRFDIAVEYLELFGKHYYLYMAMIVFPMASLLNVIGLIIDYWLDKWRLMRISAKQRSRLLRTQRRFLSYVLLLSIILSLVTPVAGVIFVLGGVTANVCSECTKCSFP